MADFAQLGIELRSIGVDKVNRDIRSVTDNANLLSAQCNLF